jgi:hypothetical protein
MQGQSKGDAVSRNWWCETGRSAVAVVSALMVMSVAVPAWASPIDYDTDWGDEGVVRLDPDLNLYFLLAGDDDDVWAIAIRDEFGTA